MPHSEPAEDRSSNGSMHKRRGVYLLTHPRSASNLFQTMMAKQKSYGADVQSSGYHFFEAAFPVMMQMDRGSLKGPQWTKADRDALYEPYKAALEKWNGELAKAEENGQQVFVKEHVALLSSPDELFAKAYGDDTSKDAPFLLRPADAAKQPAYTNPTYLPDEFLLSMQPVFQIRHPVMMFPSLLRTQLKAMPKCHPSDARFVALLTLRPSRALYDWYANHPAAYAPKVIDADDIMKDREAVRRLCQEIDFDPDAVQYEWETRKEEDPMKAAFLSTLIASKGIEPGLEARNLDIETEKVKWIAEFGEKDGEDLAKFVYDAMPDYDYLLKQRITSTQ